MNYVTAEIMNALDVSMKIALAVQDIMDDSDLDYSECTDREFHRAIKRAYYQFLKDQSPL